jgi:membrane-bound ClpP family serine protease
MVEPWVWAVILLVVGMLLAVGDIFLPSGGLLAVLAIFSIVGAVVIGFSANSALGSWVLTGALVGVPAAVVLALKVWPKTSMGRRVLLDVPTSDDVLPENDPRHVLQGLVGRVGQAKSKMLPSGIIVIDQQAYDAISEGAPVEVGQRVRVTEVRGNRLVVAGLADDSLSETDEDPLARPVDWDPTERFPPRPLDTNPGDG